MAIGPVTGREQRSYWSGNRVVRGIYGRVRDQLSVLEVKTLLLTPRESNITTDRLQSHPEAC